MNGRVAVVTGGTGAIGTEICKHLGAAGARVVAVCLPGTPTAFPTPGRPPASGTATR